MGRAAARAPSHERAGNVSGGVRHERIDVGALKARVPLAAIVGRRVALKARGPDQWGLCPFHAEKSPSFKVDRRGFYKCFGCQATGDHLTWLREVEKLAFREAVEMLEEMAGGSAASSRQLLRGPAGLEAGGGPAEDEDRARRQAHALAIWAESTAAAGSPVVRYLESRGIRVPPPASLRFHRALWQPDAKREMPAMVAAMTVEVESAFDGAPRSRVVAVHRTWLAPDGRGKADVPRAKMMLGIAAGAAVRLAPAGPRLALAEGIETALSVMQSCPGLPVWAAGSLGAIAGAGLGKGRPHPTRRDLALPSEEPDLARPGLVLPRAVRAVVILADADGDRPMQAALIERATRRWQREGRTVTVAWPALGGDFNDMVRAMPSRAA